MVVFGGRFKKSVDGRNLVVVDYKMHNITNLIKGYA